MISAISSAVATGAIVVVSKTIDKKSVISGRFVIGTGVYILMLAMINEARPELASSFALLVLLLAVYTYALPLFTGLGVIK
jgi:hypothetical protein